jgi:hypothetical protein
VRYYDRLVKTVVPALLVIASAMTVPGTAFAGVDGANADSIGMGSAPRWPAGIPSDANLVKGQLRVSCTSMSREGREYASKHGICTSGDADTLDWREGECGFSYLWIWDNGPTTGAGHAGIAIGVGSTMGPIFTIQWAVGWSNQTTGRSGSVSDDDEVLSETWDNIIDPYTGAGRVDAVFGGQVELTSGVVCTILNPTDWNNIT